MKTKELSVVQKSVMFAAVATAVCVAQFGCQTQADAAPNPKDYFKPDIQYVDGTNTFNGLARGYAAGGVMHACETVQPTSGFSAIEGGAKLRIPVYFVAPPGIEREIEREIECEFCLQVSCPVKDERRDHPPLRPIRLANAGMWVKPDNVNSLGMVKFR